MTETTVRGARLIRMALASFVFACAVALSCVPGVAYAASVLLTNTETSTEYDSLQDAINAASTGDTIVLQENIALGESTLTVPAGKVIVLELNGKGLTGETNSTSAYAMITNYGNLTIQDNTDTTKKGLGQGYISVQVNNPDTANSPSYASNLITNRGTLTVKSGKLLNDGPLGDGVSCYACYTIDNQTNGTLYTPTLNVMGGAIHQFHDYVYPVRMFCNSTTNTNTVNISGGDIAGGYGLWLQIPNANANKAVLNITGGALDALDGASLYIGGMGGGNNDYSQVSVSISNGDIGYPGTPGRTYGAIIQGAKAGAGFNVLSVSGGAFDSLACGVNLAGFVSGGTFNNAINEALLAQGTELVAESGKYRAVSHVHTYGDPTYTWSDDKSECTARAVCVDDATHVLEEVTTSASAVTQQQSCSDDEYTTYTATFTNAVFTTQSTRVKTADALGHNLSATWSNNDTHHWHECTRCDYVADMAEHTPGPAATCDDPQLCEVCDHELAGQLGHDPQLVEGCEPAVGTPGLKPYYHCDNCNKNYEDADGLILITVGLNTWRHIPALIGIVEGNGQSWTKGTTTGIAFKSTAEFANFTAVSVDGARLQKDTDYTVVEGSTVVTLKAAFLETLALGEHTIAIQSGNDIPEAKFTVKAATTPQTGDSTSVVLWVVVMAVAALGVVAGLVYSLKKRRR